jgi:hypothetical protein
MVYEKDGVKKFNSVPLQGVTSATEAKSRAEALYTLQKDGNGLKLGNILAVYKYNKSDGPVVGTFTSVIENGFDVVPEIKTYAEWSANTSAVGGAKKKTKPTPKPVTKKTKSTKKTK